MLNPKKKYNLEYYLNVVDKIVKMGAHVLGIKDSEYLRAFVRMIRRANNLQWLVSLSLVLLVSSSVLSVRSTLTFPFTSTPMTPLVPVLPPWLLVLRLVLTPSMLPSTACLV